MNFEHFIQLVLRRALIDLTQKALRNNNFFLSHVGHRFIVLYCIDLKEHMYMHSNHDEHCYFF
jgi:hypothetical protein